MKTTCNEIVKENGMVTRQPSRVVYQLVTASQGKGDNAEAHAFPCATSCEDDPVCKASVPSSARTACPSAWASRTRLHALQVGGCSRPTFRASRFGYFRRADVSAGMIQTPTELTEDGMSPR
eukprot:5724838-Pleurochrysis_carterae.AAC.1